MNSYKTTLFFLTLFSALGCGVMAGVFFAFSTFVMKALDRLPAAEAISAMQSINAVVPGSMFGLTLMITPIICFITMAAALWVDRRSTGAIYILAGGTIYILLNFILTFAFNIPLNDTLAVANPHDANNAQVWKEFFGPWVFWNHVRTIASSIAMIAFILALRD